MSRLTCLYSYGLLFMIAIASGYVQARRPLVPSQQSEGQLTSGIDTTYNITDSITYNTTRRISSVASHSFELVASEIEIVNDKFRGAFHGPPVLARVSLSWDARGALNIATYFNWYGMFKGVTSIPILEQGPNDRAWELRRQKSYRKVEKPRTNEFVRLPIGRRLPPVQRSWVWSRETVPLSLKQIDAIVEAAKKPDKTSWPGSYISDIKKPENAVHLQQKPYWRISYDYPYNREDLYIDMQAGAGRWEPSFPYSRKN